MKEMFMALIALGVMAVAIAVNDSPKTTPCDGQLVTGAIGTVEFRYCIHPTVAR